MAKKKSNTTVPAKPSDEDVQLVCSWWEGKLALDNGLRVGMDLNSGVKFELDSRSPEEEGYGNLLCAKVFQIFGVHNIGIAHSAFVDCINCILTGSNELEGKNPDEIKLIFQRWCTNVLSLFQELGPRDAQELMMVTKMIILDHLSTREFIAGACQYDEQKRTHRQSRWIKLSRLFLEFKEKIDKHRRPQQQIQVEHNHVYNEGQAIIGSQLNTVGGR